MTKKEELIYILNILSISGKFHPHAHAYSFLTKKRVDYYLN